MKIKIRDKEPIHKITMDLWLVNSSNGVKLKGLDQNNTEWTIAEMREDSLHTYSGISSTSGWPTEVGKSGRGGTIKVT